MNKLKRFQPELVVLAFPEQDQKITPTQINKGLCMRWAYMAYHMFEGVRLWSMPSHAFVRYGKKFYDSERLEGVDDWKDLPACNFGVGCGCMSCKFLGARHQNPNDFKRRWIKNPIKPNWKWYRELATSFVEKELNHESIGQATGG